MRCAATDRSSVPTRRGFRLPASPKGAAAIFAGTGSGPTSSIHPDTCRCSRSSRPSHTDPAVVATVREFADRRLGKNVVVAKDTPGFIANHVAMHGLVRIFEALAAGRYTVEEIDAMTGAAIGRPKSATFRTCRHRRPRHSRARRKRPGRAAPAGPGLAVRISAVRAGNARTRMDRRKSRARFLRAQEDRLWRVRYLGP